MTNGTIKKHDDVIEFVRAMLIKEGCNVKINKSNQKNNGINDTDSKGNKIKIYPDLYTFEEKIVKRIYEVETEDSVEESQVPQWKQYAKGVDFYLVVPKSMLEKAQELSEEKNIEVKDFLTY